MPKRSNPAFPNTRHSGLASEKELSIDRVLEEMMRIRSPFLEVWPVGLAGIDHMKVVRVAPGGPAIDLKLRAELEKASNQPSFLKRRIRGTSPEFRALGPAFLPIP